MTNKKLTSVFIIIAVLIAALSLILSISSCASKKEVSVKTAGKIEYPSYSGFVNDYTGTLTQEWKTKTEQLAANVESQTSCEIAVAVIDKLSGTSIEEYATGLFNKWGVGKKDKDNGILLLVAMSDHELRIEVGYGLEGTITDLEAKDIIDNVIAPRFKENNYNSGIYNGVAAIANKIYKEQGKAPVAYSDTVKSTPKKSFTDSVAWPIIIPIFIWLIIGGFLGAISLNYYIKTHKCPKCHKLGLIIKQTIIVKPTYDSPGTAEIEQRCRHCGYYEKKTITISKLSKYYSSGSGYSSSSFHSSSSSHSSSHSFGGGHSGGGGASGHW